MSTQEIESNNWEIFFQLFSRMEKDTLVDIDHSDSTGRRSTIATKAPLRAIQFDPTGACSNIVRIQTGTGDATHEIVEPIHVKIREEINNRKVLQIDAETGTTAISFHSGRMQELLSSLTNSRKEATR